MPNGAGIPGSAGARSDPPPNRAFLDRCLAEAKATTAVKPDPLGNKPLIVIANRSLADSEDYKKFQVGLLALSHNSVAMVSATPGHGVPMNDPEIFVRAIRQVVVTVRAQLGLDAP
jgi:hypothetical protein